MLCRDVQRSKSHRTLCDSVLARIFTHKDRADWNVDHFVCLESAFQAGDTVEVQHVECAVNHSGVLKQHEVPSCSCAFLWTFSNAWYTHVCIRCREGHGL